MADLGCRSKLAWARLRDLDVLLLETNHDLEMLRSGPYPWRLKQRVASGHGHLSNRAAAEGMPELLCDRLRFVVLYHLSRTNNLPALAAAAVAGGARRASAPRPRCVIADQFEPSSWLSREIESLVKARIDVYPRREILDPQGKAIRARARALGFAEVAEVRAGKSFEIELGAVDAAAAKKTARSDVREAARQHRGRGVRRSSSWRDGRP